MIDTSQRQLLDLAQAAVSRARLHGADAADALVVDAHATEVEVRERATESIERSESCELGLRVFIGHAQAVVSASRFSPSDLDGLAERAVAMARAAPPDPYAGLPDASELATDDPELALADEASPDAPALLELALEAEGAGLAVPKVTKSAGASASAARRTIGLVTSAGFASAYTRTSYSVSSGMIAGSGTAMERDYDFSHAVQFRDLESPAKVGRSAGERAARRLNPKKIVSQRVPVVFDRRVAGGLLGHLANAILGSTIARGTSFLQDRLGTRVFPRGIAIIDDARRLRGVASKPFDGEGVATRRLAAVEDGMLNAWLLDCRSARQLDRRTTGHASRGAGGAPSPSSTNLYLEPGRTSPQALVSKAGRGLLVTELMGMGVNGVTGDYSRGASGFWIEGGEISFPVSEITIASNLKDMFAAFEPADDLEFRTAVNAPSVLVGEMTLAGH